MSKKMLIDARHPEETRVAVLSGDKVEDFDFETLSRRPLRGNIYLARITRVEPSLQAAFVEYGGNRHGFLAFSEIHPDYYQIPVSDREVLRAAEALEAELAAKLAEYDQDSIADLDDDDDTGAAPENGDSEPDNGAAAESSDEEDSSQKSSRGRRGRGRRRSRSRKSDDRPVEASDENGDAASQDDAATEENDGTEDTDRTNAANASDSADYAGADSDEDPSWHGTDEDVIAALPEEAAAGDDVEEADDTDDADDTPKDKPIPLAARTPVLSEELPEDDEASDEDEDDAPAAREDSSEAGDEEPDASETDIADPTVEEPVSEDADDASEEANADDADDREEPKPARARKVEDPAEVSRRKEIADLERRYQEARRERDRLLRNYRIQEVIKRRQIMLVQVVKEERGNKGAALTTYLSLAGRYGVLMPNNARGGGVSRKITNQTDRKRLRKAIKDLDVPKGQGLIIRTAGAKRTKAEIKRDYDYLARLWDTIRGQTLESIAPSLIYEEASLIKRAIRDLYDKDTTEILVEGEEGYREAKDFMKMLMPSHAKNVQPYRDTVPLFLRYHVERQLDEMYQPVVKLKSGGYLVIQQTEALISIDVNSGRSTKERNVEATALKTNGEAAVEVARQCRLRDLAGLIVIDFIDMEENRNNRSVEKKLKDALKADRARIQTSTISNFGLLEMSRQRRRSGIVDGTTRVCPVCDGAGNVRSVEMASLRILRAIEETVTKDRAAVVTVSTSQDVALYILNQKRSWLNRIEDGYKVFIEISSDHRKSGDQYDISTSGEPREIDTLRQAPNQDLVDAAEADAGDADMPEDETDSADSQADADSDGSEDGGNGRKRRRRRRGKSNGTADQQDAAASDENAQADASDDEADSADHAASGDDEQPKKRRRRGRRGGRRNKSNGDATSNGEDRAADRADGDAEPEKAQAAMTDAVEKKDATTTAAPANDAATGEAPMADRAHADAAPDRPVATPEHVAPAELAEADAAPLAAAEDTAPADDVEAEAPARPSVHAPVPDSVKPASDEPKRGGWWQRAFKRDG
jgi:ribonuclease E